MGERPRHKAVVFQEEVQVLDTCVEDAGSDLLAVSPPIRIVEDELPVEEEMLVQPSSKIYARYHVVLSIKTLYERVGKDQGAKGARIDTARTRAVITITDRSFEEPEPEPREKTDIEIMECSGLGLEKRFRSISFRHPFQAHKARVDVPVSDPAIPPLMLELEKGIVEGIVR